VADAATSADAAVATDTELATDGALSPDLAPLAPDGGPVTCVVRPEQEEGPYFIDEMLERKDVRMDPSNGMTSPGTELRLQFRVYSVDGKACKPLEGAVVDLWHANAGGVYSDAKDINGMFDTRGKKFLRGFQKVDSAGAADFVTIYPGWYDGRAVHLHFKIRTKNAAGRNVEFTTQLYFADTVTDTVHTQAAYRKPGRRLRNAQDGVFGRTGPSLVLPVAKDGTVYTATWDIGLKLA
jgi:protocatechuate 3,4-dioxygenase beta subunit